MDIFAQATKGSLLRKRCSEFFFFQENGLMPGFVGLLLSHIGR